MKIGVVDYNAGNLKSVETALLHLGADFFISSDVNELKKAEKLIFPGVGEAASAMENLRERNLIDFLKEYARGSRPFLGICLGSQIMLDFSEERDTNCLGMIEGKSVKFPKREGFKVPQIGWNTVTWAGDHPLRKGIPDEISFYFVHSYHTVPSWQENILATSDYGQPFVCALQKDNLMATQFHPEKSGEYGLKILKNFIEVV